MLLNPLGIPHAASLVYYTMGTGPDIQLRFSDQQYEALRSILGTDLLVWQSHKCGLQASEELISADCALATGNAFSILGLQPFLGRFFGEGDDVPGGGKDGWTAVVSYSYWKAHPGVVGQTITVNDILVHVVGVLPREFAGIDSLRSLDILLPSHFKEAAGWGLRILGGAGSLTHIIDPEWFVLGQLPSGVSIEQAQANLRAIEPTFQQATDLTEQTLSNLFPNTTRGSLLNVYSAQMGVTCEVSSLADSRFSCWNCLPALFCFILLFMVILILLLVSRARREAHATAIRLVLGARLSDQARLSMAEGATLAGMGCVMAAPIAWATARGLSLAIQSAPGFSTFPTVLPSRSLLLLAAAIAMIIACLTSAGASVWLGRRRVSIRLKEVVGGKAATRPKGWIVGVEVFASVVLMSGAVVSGVGFQTLSRHSGFGDGSSVWVNPHIVLTYGFEGMDRLVNLIQNSPGVQAVATTDSLPLPLSGGGLTTAEAHSADGSVRQLPILADPITLPYFSATGTKIVRGRDFTPADLAGDPVCVLSNNAATALFPNGNSLGKYLTEPPCRIVGVAEDAHFRSMSEPADAVVYELTKHVRQSIVARAANSRLAMQAAHEAVNTVVLQGIGPDRGVTMGIIQESVDKDLRLWRVITLSGVLCAMLAAIILAIGLFGVLSLQVAEREREIGIRRALGANFTHVSLALLKTARPRHRFRTSPRIHWAHFGNDNKTRRNLSTEFQSK